MLKLTLEIFPFGDESSREVLAEVEIANVSNFRVPVANYRCLVQSKDWKPRVVKLKEHKRSDGYWPLIRRLARHMERVE